MADETTILSVAEAERDNAEQRFREHVRKCKCLRDHGCTCDDCRSLARHVARTKQQVALLAAAEMESEALF